MEFPELSPASRAAVALAARLARARVRQELDVADPSDIYEVAQAIEQLDPGVSFLIDPETDLVLEISVDGMLLDVAVVLQAAVALALALAQVAQRATGQPAEQLLADLIGVAGIPA